ncbi:9354_t:CDS:2, partial [Cetraspora pellucida]
LCNENIGRCEGYLKICKEIDPEIKQQYFSSSFSSSYNSQQIVVVQKQNNITNFLDRISFSEQSKMEYEFAQAIYKRGLPLKKLSTTLLDQIYLDTKNKIDKKINKTEFISIISDG